MSFTYFTLDEFACKETGENHIDPNFVARLDVLRARCGFPFVITSGYRSPEHSVEKKKEKPGQHTKGDAADIAVSGGAQKYTLIKEAMRLGFHGIGVGSSFIHVDDRDSIAVVWSY